MNKKGSCMSTSGNVFSFMFGPEPIKGPLRDSLAKSKGLHSSTANAAN